MSSVAMATPSQLGTLILVWLLAQPEGRGTRSGLDRALKAILEQRWSDAERRRALDDEVASLERANRISRPRRGTLLLRESGRRAGLAALGVKALSAGLSWRNVKNRYLLARALELPAPTTKAAAERIGDIDGLRAAILARHHGLGVGDLPTLIQVRDALAWRALGVETQERFTLNAVLELLLNRTLGAATPEEPRKVLELLAVRAVGARRADVEELRVAVLRRWLGGKGMTPIVEPRDEAPPGPSVVALVEPLEDDSAFAARVIAAAKASETGRFGSDKVFISHVFQQLVNEGVSAGDPELFKARLVSAHRRGLLSLSRADLVEAMHPEDVDASETRYLSATFHFVRI